MTQIIDYSKLSWQEVAGLDRKIPLILPLGEGFNWERLASTLSHPSQMVILPSFPYGWQKSLLYVPEKILNTYLLNLIQSIRDDGFINTYVLSDNGIDLGLGSLQIVQATNQGIPPTIANSDVEKVVLIPIGHTEQHGFHLPMATDTLIIQAISDGVLKTIPEKVFGLPVMPYGVSTHRNSFAGTFNAGGRAFEDFYLAVIDFLVIKGFRRFYLISGHGGNCSFLVNVVKYAGEKYPHIFCATSYLYLNTPQGISLLEKFRQSPIGGMGHACELETSLMLVIEPNTVKIEKAVDEVEFISTPSYYMDWIEGGSLIANPPWTDDTKTGAYGAGSLGTSEKGKIWLEAAINEKIGHIYEIEEQYQRRLKRKF
ncbi:MAG: creatininase family protein [Anaerolineales bacterium]